MVDGLVEVTIDSIRVSLMSQHRIVVLREDSGERFIPIWIGPFEADAITIQLQGMEPPRPLTHDLIRAVVETMGGEVERVVINGLEKQTYFAKIVLEVEGDLVEVDSRPSDAIALAVRTSAPIYISEDVMDQAGMEPEEEMTLTEGVVASDGPDMTDEDLGAFEDLIEGLDLDNLLGK